MYTRSDDGFEEIYDYGLREREPRRTSIFWRRRPPKRRKGNRGESGVLNSWQRFSIAAILAAGMFSLAYALVNVAFKDQLIVLKERNSQHMRISYEDRLAAMRAAMDGLNGRMLLDQEEYLRKVDELKNDLDAIVERQRRMETFFKQGWLPARVLNGSDPGLPSDGKPRLKTNESPPAAGNGGKGDRRTDIRSDGTTVYLRPGKRTPAESTHFVEKYVKRFTTHDSAHEPLFELGRMFDALGREQMDLLDRIDKSNDRRLRIVREAIRYAGLDPKTVERNTPSRSTNVGGPFVDPKDPDFNDDLIGNKLLTIGRKIATHDKLTYAMKRMPLPYPMHGAFRITSDFGLRRDPFRRTRAMHTGIDLKAPYGHPVRATAAGVVTKAGWRGAFGRTVELRHPHGVVTIYAHLRRIHVKAGQRVKAGQKIGALGNTGRSTGPHLHYETRIYRKAISPHRFWKMREVLR